MNRNTISTKMDSLRRSALFEKASLFLGMYIVTVSLFWFETGMLSKGLVFGIIAASLKTALARGHARVFANKCPQPPGNQLSQVTSCANSSGPIAEPLAAFCEKAGARKPSHPGLYDDIPWGPASPCPPTLQTLSQ